jgi:hypothetical protein
MVGVSLVTVVDHYCTMKSRLSPAQKGQKSSSALKERGIGGLNFLSEVAETVSEAPIDFATTQSCRVFGLTGFRARSTGGFALTFV